MPPIYNSPGYSLQDILGRGPTPTTGFIDRGTAQSRYNRGLMTSGIAPFLQAYLQQQFDPLYGAFSMMQKPTGGSNDFAGFVDQITKGNLANYTQRGRMERINPAYAPFVEEYPDWDEMTDQQRQAQADRANPLIKPPEFLRQTGRERLQQKASNLADMMGTAQRGIVTRPNPAYSQFMDLHGWDDLSDTEKTELGLTPPPETVDVQTGGTYQDGVFTQFEPGKRFQYDRYMDNPREQYNAALTGAGFGVHPLFRGGTQSALRRLFESMGGEEMGTPFLSAAKAAGYF
jgi:hypothetical protein